MIDPGALRALTAIARVGTVAAAADDLGFTPSAVSQQVKRLETQVGTPLLARVGRGVVLTAAGESLVRAAPEVFAALERATEAARASTTTVAGTLRVVAFSTAIRGLLVEALRDLASLHPGLQVSIEEADPAEAAATVTSGAADLAVLHDLAGLPARPGGAPAAHTLSSVELLTDAGDVIVPSAHPLAGRRVVTAADLAGETWVTSPPGTACHDWFLRLFAGAPTPRVRHRIDDFSTQLALVAAGGVVALIPRLARPPLPDGVVALPVDPAPGRRVEAVWRVSSDESPGIRALVAALHRAASG